MTGDTHYDLEVLAELAEGLLDAATARPIRAHLAICEPCGELLADLAAVREVLAALPPPAMPMGVALRIDQAIAAEAERRAPGRDRPARHSGGDSPVEERPVRLGVVADDGTIVPARRRERRRGKWMVPAAATVAACAVIGSVALSSTFLTVTDGPEPSADVAAAPDPPRESQSALAYKVTVTDYNFSDRDLRGSLSDYFAPAPLQGGAESIDDKLSRCVSKVAKRVGKTPFQVNQGGYYLGQEATIMLFWKNQAADRVEVRVLDPECKSLRKPATARWQ